MVTKDNWRTPDFAVYPTISWRLDLPDSVDVQKALLGALFLLTDPDNWTAVGTATPDTMAEVMLAIIGTIEEVFTVNMIGTIMPYASESPPAGCLICDGSEYDEDEYPELAAVLNEAFLNGDGTFNVPDLQSRFVYGFQYDGAGAVGDTGGEVEHTLTVNEMPAHHHNFLRANAPTASKVTSGTEGAIQFRNNADTDSTGGSQPHNNMPPYIILGFCIVAVAT